MWSADSEDDRDLYSFVIITEIYSMIKEGSRHKILNEKRLKAFSDLQP